MSAAQEAVNAFEEHLRQMQESTEQESFRRTSACKADGSCRGCRITGSGCRNA